MTAQLKEKEYRALERSFRAVILRERGLTYKAIGREFGVSANTARGLVMRGHRYDERREILLRPADLEYPDYELPRLEYWNKLRGIKEYREKY